MLLGSALESRRSELQRIIVLTGYVLEGLVLLFVEISTTADTGYDGLVGSVN